MSWFNYFDKRRVPFAIRICKDSLCESWCPVYTLFAHLKLGELKTLHQPYYLYGCSLRLAGMKIAANDYAIIVTNRTPAPAFLAYKRRWEIEMLFSALKKTSFELEATHLTNLAKFDTLFTLLSVAFVWAHHVGEWLHDTRIKPLRLKSHLRREKLVFRHGLDHLRFLLKNLPRKHPDLSFCIQLLSRT